MSTFFNPNQNTASRNTLDNGHYPPGKSDPCERKWLRDQTVTCWNCKHEYSWEGEIGRCPKCNHHQPDIY